MTPWRSVIIRSRESYKNGIVRLPDSKYTSAPPPPNKGYITLGDHDYFACHTHMHACTHAHTHTHLVLAHRIIAMIANSMR